MQDENLKLMKKGYPYKLRLNKEVTVHLKTEKQLLKWRKLHPKSKIIKPTTMKIKFAILSRLSKIFKL